MKKRPDASRDESGEGGPGDDQVLEAAQFLSQGGVVAFPTETYYGLAVDPDNETALSRLFQVKNRPWYKPVLLLIHDLSLLDSLVTAIPEAYRPLIAQHWPGPLTLIFPARAGLSSYLTGGTETVGIRISPHPKALALGRAFGKAITATSANLSGRHPARFAAEVVSAFGSDIDYVIDGGKTPAGPCSTIVGLYGGKLCLLRPGAIEIAGLKTCQPGP